MDLTGKIAVISGGTSGIGKTTALMLAARRAEVVVIGRDPDKGNAVAAELRQASGGSGSFVKADLSLIGEARRVVDELSARFERIDAFIQSAGVIDFEVAQTSEGLNRVFVTNFLHKVVLAEGLAASLARAQGRMVLVAADVPDGMGLDWANFEGARVYSGVMALPRLQAASLAVAQRFATEWKERKIEVTAIHPGQVDTGIYRSFDRWYLRAGKFFMKPFLVPVERPAELLTWLSFSPEAQGLSGHLFPSVKNRRKRRHLRRDPQMVERVWKATQEVLGGLNAARQGAGVSPGARGPEAISPTA